MRVSVRRSAATPQPAAEPPAPVARPRPTPPRARRRPRRGREPDGRHVLPRPPGPAPPPFVEEGDPVSPGQVLCILEAMKLMNEVKAEIEAIVRRSTSSTAQPVEYGQLLFELEPLNGRPIGI